MRFGDDKVWLWAIDGAFGVLAGALSLALAMVLGSRGVVAIGLVAYAVAAGLMGGEGAAARAAKTAA